MEQMFIDWIAQQELTGTEAEKRDASPIWYGRFGDLSTTASVSVELAVAIRCITSEYPLPPLTNDSNDAVVDFYTVFEDIIEIDDSSEYMDTYTELKATVTNSFMNSGVFDMTELEMITYFYENAGSKMDV